MPAWVEVESALMLTGWQSTALDAYDQRYYRRWMLVPAMQHMFRGTALDVHLTASRRPPRASKPDARPAHRGQRRDPPACRALKTSPCRPDPAQCLTPFHEGEPITCATSPRPRRPAPPARRPGRGTPLARPRAERLQLTGPLRPCPAPATACSGHVVAGASAHCALGGQTGGGPCQPLLDTLYLRWMLEPSTLSAADGLRGIAHKLFTSALAGCMPPSCSPHHLA